MSCLAEKLGKYVNMYSKTGSWAEVLADVHCRRTLKLLGDTLSYSSTNVLKEYTPKETEAEGIAIYHHLREAFPMHRRVCYVEQ